MTKNALSRLALLLGMSVLPNASCWAFDSAYSPFSGASPLPQCSVEALQKDEQESSGFDRIIYATKKLKVEILSDEEGRMQARLLDKAQNRELIAPVELEGAMVGFSGVSIVNITPDGKPDFVINNMSGGVGLAGGYASLTLLVSTPQGYRPFVVATYDPSLKDWLRLGKTCALVQTTPIWAERTRDGRPHTFWVYNLLQFDQGRARYANSTLPEFPKWILYSFKPNHQATRLLSPQEKRQLWAQREAGYAGVAKTVPPAK